LIDEVTELSTLTKNLHVLDWKKDMHEGAPQNNRPESSPSGSLRSLLEAQQRKEKNGSYAETVKTLFGSWTERLAQGESREVVDEMKRLEPGLLSVLQMLEEQDDFAEALRHLKMKREILRLKIMIGYIQNRKDIVIALEEQMEKVDAELASVADLLVKA